MGEIVTFLEALKELFLFGLFIYYKFIESIGAIGVIILILVLIYLVKTFIISKKRG